MRALVYIYFSWDRDDAVEYLLNYTALSGASAEIEIDRYITWPGQATAYKTGEMYIKELRQKAMDVLGGYSLLICFPLDYHV